MSGNNFHIDLPVFNDNIHECTKGISIVLLHADRIPPHAGLMFNGNYNSLTIKSAEFNVSCDALLRTIEKKKINSLFIRVSAHPVFSMPHLLEMFQEQLKQYSAVEANGPTCLTPLKAFFNEFYATSFTDSDLLHEFLYVLNRNSFLQKAFVVGQKPLNTLSIPFYTAEDLQKRIAEETDASVSIHVS